MKLQETQHKTFLFFYIYMYWLDYTLQYKWLKQCCLPLGCTESPTLSCVEWKSMSLSTLFTLSNLSSSFTRSCLSENISVKKVGRIMGRLSMLLSSIEGSLEKKKTLANVAMLIALYGTPGYWQVLSQLPTDQCRDGINSKECRTEKHQQILYYFYLCSKYLVRNSPTGQDCWDYGSL